MTKSQTIIGNTIIANENKHFSTRCSNPEIREAMWKKPIFNRTSLYHKYVKKAHVGNVTQNIHPPLNQSTLIHIQTHTCRQSCIDSLKINVRHTYNKGEDKSGSNASFIIKVFVCLWCYKICIIVVS